MAGLPRAPCQVWGQGRRHGEELWGQPQGTGVSAQLNRTVCGRAGYSPPTSAPGEETALRTETRRSSRPQAQALISLCLNICSWLCSASLSLGPTGRQAAFMPLALVLAPPSFARCSSGERAPWRPGAAAPTPPRERPLTEAPRGKLGGPTRDRMVGRHRRTYLVPSVTAATETSPQRDAGCMRPCQEKLGS